MNTPTSYLRFVQRDGRLMLQQYWTPRRGIEAIDGKPTDTGKYAGEWRDVPTEPHP